jgi:hypothetical protein
MARALVLVCFLSMCLHASSTSASLTLSSVLANLNAAGLTQLQSFSLAKQQAIIVEMNSLQFQLADLNTVRFGPDGAVRQCVHSLICVLRPSNAMLAQIARGENSHQHCQYTFCFNSMLSNGAISLFPCHLL